jgi:hypothetical protein
MLTSFEFFYTSKGIIHAELYGSKSGVPGIPERVPISAVEYSLN